MKFEGYEIKVSDKPDKKYYAIVEGRKVYFGARGYGHYRDVLGHYSSLDHKDKKRRDAYYARHKVNYGKGTADWFSKKILWPK